MADIIDKDGNGNTLHDSSNGCCKQNVCVEC